jgi:hypothetical protein
LILLALGLPEGLEFSEGRTEQYANLGQTQSVHCAHTCAHRG